jgi:hypothetical protein
MIFATTLMAQEGPRGARAASGIPPLTEVKAYLGLSDAQVTQLTDLRKQLREAVAPLASQAADKRKNLADLLSANSTDTATIGQLRQDLSSTRKQMRDLASQYGNNARSVLSADQQAKLQALEEAVKLLPTIRQAQALNLIEGAGPFGGMMGDGMGAGMMGRRPPR